MARLGSRQFSADVGDMIANLGIMDRRLDAAVGITMTRSKDQAVAYMKVRAPWTDQTGNARSGLDGSVFRQRGGWVMNLFGRVSYQIYLETNNGRRFAILGPTILLWGPRTMTQLTGLLDRLGGGRV